MEDTSLCLQWLLSCASEKSTGCLRLGFFALAFSFWAFWKKAGLTASLLTPRLTALLLSSSFRQREARDRILPLSQDRFLYETSRGMFFLLSVFVLFPFAFYCSPFFPISLASCSISIRVAVI